MPKPAIEDVKLNKIMGDYFEVALNYLLLLPISDKYENLSFHQLPQKIKKDLLKSTIKWMGKPSNFLFNKSPLELTLTGDISLLVDHLSEMGSKRKGKDS